MKTGLVLEGGGMRGLFTAGVLDCLTDEHITFDYCIGVSAGACNAVSFLSGQRGRNKRINLTYALDKRYVSVSNFVKTKSMFGMDFIFCQIPDELDPFDYEALEANPAQFVVGVTDAQTGQPFYFDKSAVNHDSTVMRASSSIPVFSPPVAFRGGVYLDGGTTDPIPVKKALADGCDRVLVVLTRERGYQKPPEGHRGIYKRALKKYPAMITALDRRHEVYNKTLEQLSKLEQSGTALVLAPPEKVTLSRFEKDPAKLERLYDQGYQEAKKTARQIAAFLSKETVEKGV